MGPKSIRVSRIVQAPAIRIPRIAPAAQIQDHTWMPKIKMNDQLKTEFGNRLEKAIAREGLSQTEFARKIGMKTTTLNGYCRGRREPDFARIMQMCLALPSTPPAYLYLCDLIRPDEGYTRIVDAYAVADDPGRALLLRAAEVAGSYDAKLLTHQPEDSD
jgi:transcriptional regulator with XRE-family HTH domain